MVGKNIKFEKRTLKDYSKKAYFWEREKPKIQSDFICRPYVLKLLGDVKNKVVVDIGCGEGYVCRLLASKGAKVIGIDPSKGLIKSAIEREKNMRLGIKYYVGSALNLNKIKSNSVDIALSVLVFVHLSKKGMSRAIKETKRILKPNGIFVLAVPHPSIYILKPKTKWISFNYKELNYWSDKTANISLFTCDRDKFDIMTKQHTLSSYVNSLINEGFIIKKMLEPRPSEKDLRTYPKMWGEETRLPFYLIIQAQKK